jgi:hypothetical protein
MPAGEVHTPDSKQEAVKTGGAIALPAPILPEGRARAEGGNGHKGRHRCADPPQPLPTRLLDHHDHIMHDDSYF